MELITKELLIKLNVDADKWLEHLKNACDRFDINTKDRVNMFLVQCAHESNHFKSLSENLNYSAQGLANTWPSRYAVDPKANPKVPNAKANSIARKPVEIANHCYANRIGNGDEQSGDGNRYRGRGLIQLTGKANYKAYSDAIGVDLVANPDLVAEPLHACLSAAWFWSKNKLNSKADAKDIKGSTQIINGGLLGLAERESLYKKISVA